MPVVISIALDISRQLGCVTSLSFAHPIQIERLLWLDTAFASLARRIQSFAALSSWCWI